MKSKFVDVSSIIADLKEMSDMTAYDALEYERRSCYGTVAEMMEQAPAVDVAPVKRGKWIPVKRPIGSFDDVFKCSECHSACRPDHWWFFCPRCGAKMDA